MIELSNVTFLMRGFKDKNIQNQQVDYNSDRLSNLTGNNDTGGINKQKILKTWLGIFENTGRNFPGGNSLGGSLIGGIFPGGSFPDTQTLYISKIST